MKRAPSRLDGERVALDAAVDLGERRLLGGRGAGGHLKAETAAERGQRDGDRARPADDDLRARQHRLHEDVHRALARAHVLGETHALALLAGGDALRLQHVWRLHRDEPRLAVGERLARGLQHRAAGAAAADPALRDRCRPAG